MTKTRFHLHSILFLLFSLAFMAAISIVLLPLGSDVVFAAEVSLAWDANSEQDLAGYKLYYKTGTGTGSYNGTGANEGTSPLTVYLKDMINSNAPSFTLTGLGNGMVYSFSVTAFSTSGMESDFSNQVNITTALPVENQEPRADAGEDQTVTEGETVYLNGANSADAEGSLSRFQWKQVAGPTVILNDPENAQASFTTPDVGSNGVALSFELQVTDGGGLSNTDTCTVNVSWANDVPIAAAGPDRAAIPNELVTLDGSKSYDPDGGIMTYRWVQKQGPTVSISNPAIPSPTFKVPESATDATSFVFELTVGDAGGLISTDECIIHVALPIPIVSATESPGVPGKANEPSNTAVKDSKETLPSTNTSSNKAPIASAGQDRTAIPNEFVTLDGSGSYDSDGKIVAHQWFQKQGPVVSLQKASTESAGFKVPKTVLEGTTFVFELAVTDNGGLTSKDECIVKVTRPFSIASATETEVLLKNADAPATETSNQEAEILTDGGSGKSEESTDVASPDAPIAKQNNSNRVPVCPLPIVHVGDDPLLGPVELAVEGFVDPDAGDNHAKTQWQVYRTEDKVCVLDTLTPAYLTLFRIPEIMLDENTSYFWRARFFDNHGAASEWSVNTHITTAFSDTDTDGNGIPDDQEVDISVDMNRDGMPDAHQAVVRSIMIPSCNEPIGLSIENSNTVTAILSMSAVDPVDYNFAPEDEAKINQLPFGLINFKLAVEQPGDMAAVTVHFSQPVSTIAKWVKFNPVKGVWMDYSAHARFSDDRMAVNLEFVDGGFGDDDGVVNGVIVDPSGLDGMIQSTSVSMQAADDVDTESVGGSDNGGSSGGGGGGGGGCFVTGAMEETQAGLPLMAVCMFLLFGVALMMRFGDRKMA